MPLHATPLPPAELDAILRGEPPAERGQEPERPGKHVGVGYAGRNARSLQAITHRRV